MREMHTYNPYLLERVIVFQGDDIVSKWDELKVIGCERDITKHSFFLKNASDQGRDSRNEQYGI
jgi:hypothetical protein